LLANWQYFASQGKPFLLERPHNELLNDLGLLGFAVFHPPCEPDPIKLVNRFRREVELTVRSFFRRFSTFWQRFEITEFLKVDGPSALCLSGAMDSSVCCGVAVRLYEGSENQRVIGQCLELVSK
jgi:hypothetical protein